MTVMTSAGSSIAIGSAPATYDSTGFAAVSYTTIGQVTDLGAYGRTYTEVNFLPLSSRIKSKFKGSYDNGSLQLKLGKDVTDAGQTAALAALSSDNSYAFKVTLQNGTIAYFTGKVMTATTNVGNVDQITALDMTIAIDNNIIEV